MKKIKLARIDRMSYCKYPDEISDIKEFVEHLNQNYNSFVELEFLKEEGCVAPYFIDEDLKTEIKYINTANIRVVCECEVTLLNRSEYIERLHEVIQQKCIHCVNYEEHSGDENLKGHWENISLDGECYGFELKKDN